MCRMDKLEIEIGANTEEMRRNVLAGIETLGKLKTAAEEGGQKIDNISDSYKNAPLVDERAANAAAKKLNDFADMLENTDERINGMMKDLARVLGGDLSENLSGSKELVSRINAELSSMVREWNRYEQAAQKGESRLRALHDEGTKRQGQAKELEETAQAYERLGDSYLHAAEEAEKAALEMRSSADSARASGVEGMKLALELDKQAEAMSKQASASDEQAEHFFKLADARRSDAEAAKKGEATQKKILLAQQAATAAVQKHERELEVTHSKTAIAMDKASKSIERFSESQKKSVGNIEKENAALEKERQKLQAAADAAERENAVNKLLGKSYLNVASELRSLNRERNAAARSGDTERVRQLTKEINIHRDALRQLRQARQMDKITLTQQAQLAGQVTSSMKSLGEQISNLGKGAQGGAVDVSALTNTVIQLGFAIKAGLGPLGWALVAVEGLTSAWNLYTESQKAARKATLDHAKAVEDAAEKSYKVAKNKIDREQNDRKKAAEEELKDIKQQYDEELGLIDRLEQGKRIIRKQEIEELKKEQAAAEAELAKTGTEVEIEAMRHAHAVRMREMEREHQEEEEGYKEYRADLEQKAADAVLEKRTELLNALELTYAKFVDFDAKNDDSAREFLRLIDEVKENREITAAKLTETNTALEAYKQVQEGFFERMANDIADAFDSAGTNQEKTQRESEHYQELIAQKNALTNEDAATLQRINEINAQIEAEHKAELDLVRDLEEAEGLDAAGMLQLYFHIKERLKAEQRTQASANEAAKLADANVNDMELTKEANKAIYESDLKLLDANHELAAKKAQEKLIEEQKRKAKEEEKKIQDALNKELKSILDTTKTTGTYTATDARTQRQILEDDKRLLSKRQRELTKMLNNEHLTEEQRRSINDELRNVRNQTRGLAEAQNRNAAEARKWLKELTPPKLTATKKLAQANLNNLAKAYARQAKAAERAASSGNEKALERWGKQLRRTATAMGRVSGKSEQTDKLYSDTMDKLKAASRNNDRAAKATGKVADNAEKAARESAKNLGQGKFSSAAAVSAKMDEMNVAIRNANKSVTELNGSITTAGQGMSSLSSVITSMANASTAAFGNIGSILKQHSAELANLRKAINSINGIR